MTDKGEWNPVRSPDGVTGPSVFRGRATRGVLGMIYHLLLGLLAGVGVAYLLHMWSIL